MNNVEIKANKKRWKILLTVVSATFMATLDGSIVNVALPNMSDKLNVSMASIEWVVTSFLITISAAILIFGRLGDIKGKTKVFKFGVVVFTLGSLLCGLTDSLPMLVSARVIQAIGAAAAMGTNQGIVTQVFPANERGRALGVLGTFVALGAMAGPPLGGIIVSAFGWEYIFLVNVPIGIFAFVSSIKIFPRSTTATGEKFDSLGAVLFAVSTILSFGALVEGQSIGYDNPYMIGAFVLSIITFVLFIRTETKTEQPLLYLKIFSNSLFTISILCGFISFIVISASNIILPFYFQDVLKLTPAAAGFFMMVSPIVLSVVAPCSGYLSDKIGSEILTLIGLALTGLGLFLISSLNETSGVFLIIVFIAIMSAGNGMFQSPNNSLVMSTVTRDKLGIAGSINALIRNLGMVIGTSLATMLLYNKMSEKAGYRVIDYVKGRDDIFIYGMKFVYISAAVLCIFGVLITAVRYYSGRKSKKL